MEGHGYAERADWRGRRERRKEKDVIEIARRSFVGHKEQHAVTVARHWQISLGSIDLASDNCDVVLDVQTRHKPDKVQRDEAGFRVPTFYVEVAARVLAQGPAYRIDVKPSARR